MQVQRQELKNQKQLKHINHLEELLFTDSELGFEVIKTVLKSFKNNSKKNIRCKIDGCIHESSIIITNKGNLTVKEIVNRNDITHVLAHDFKDGLDKMTPLLNSMVKEGSKEWVEILLENGHSIKLTNDHEVYTNNRGWVKAIDLQEYDDIKEI